MKVLNLVQFHNEPDNRDFFIPNVDKFYVVKTMDSSREVYVGDDDDGESIYEDRDAIKVWDEENEQHEHVIQDDDLEFFTFTLELEKDSNLFRR